MGQHAHTMRRRLIVFSLNTAQFGVLFPRVFHRSSCCHFSCLSDFAEDKAVRFREIISNHISFTSDFLHYVYSGHAAGGLSTHQTSRRGALGVGHWSHATHTLRIVHGAFYRWLPKRSSSALSSSSRIRRALRCSLSVASSDERTLSSGALTPVVRSRSSTMSRWITTW